MLACCQVRGDHLDPIEKDAYLSDERPERLVLAVANGLLIYGKGNAPSLQVKVGRLTRYVDAAMIAVFDPGPEVAW